MDEKRITDYFVVAGLVDEGREPLEDYVSQENVGNRRDLIMSPITHLAVINRSEGEAVPEGFTCIETTPNGFPADLNHGSIRSSSVFLCYKRSKQGPTPDYPPLTDIGVLFESKERVMSDSEVVHTTPYGRPANVNNSNSNRTFVTYRRSRPDDPCNQLVVTDIVVILANKGEIPPHAYCLIPKNLNKSVVGSDVYLCYKKSMNRPRLKSFKPHILDRFPLVDYPRLPLPQSVPLFCLPMGATVEVWPKKARQPKPLFSTFVLTSDVGEKVYGSAITFYERFPRCKLTEKDLEELAVSQLTLSSSSGEPEKKKEIPPYTLNAMKSICILSRWPFFDTFERYLMFLYTTQLASMKIPSPISLEMYISHFMQYVPFPSPQRPKVLLQLGMAGDETVMIEQPPEYLPLPLSGASFTALLRNLGPENCINVLLFAVTEQKILLHSLRPDVLTSVSEAVLSIIFPFHWQCPYIPLCPLSLCDVLCAPLPFIVGVDSRYFDLYEPPVDVVCVDLDTNSIYLSELKRHLNTKLIPKRATRILKSNLEKLYENLSKPYSNGNAYNAHLTRSRSCTSPPFGVGEDEARERKMERLLDLEIQEAFIRFMAQILRNFRQYFLPITRAPKIGSTDPTSLFDFSGFLKSRDKAYHRFYQLIMRTQMFTRFIEERSFVSDKDASLAFFDECADKVESVDPNSTFSGPLRLLDIDDVLLNDRTVFIPPPEPPAILPSGGGYTYLDFGSLKHDLYLAPPTEGPYSLLENTNEFQTGDTSNLPGSPMARRTKQELRSAQRAARRHAETPISWVKCLVSYCYGLWFVHLPSYVKFTTEKNCQTNSQALHTAFDVLLRMQELKLHPADELCYRILMLLCGIHSQPVLAVKILFQMKSQGVTPNAITYGYYNKAVLESTWPANDVKATLMWNKLRNVLSGVSKFKENVKIRAERLSESPDSPPKMETPTTESGEPDQNKLIKRNLLTTDQIEPEMDPVIEPKSIVKAKPHSQDSSRQPLLSERSEELVQRLNSFGLTDTPHESAIKSNPDSRKKPKEPTDVNQSPEDASLRPLKESESHPLALINLDPSPTEKPPEHNETSAEGIKGDGLLIDLISEQPQKKSGTDNSDLMTSLSPIKDAVMKMDLFAPDGKVASTVRSSFKMASKFTKDKMGNNSMARSSTFHGYKISSMLRRDSSKSIQSETDFSPEKQTRTLPRSATLPVTPTRQDSLEARLESEIAVDDKRPSQPATTSSASEVSSQSSFSPWTTKLTSSKHSELVYSTIRSAASNVASRLNEFKSNITNTPSKPGTGTASQEGPSLFSQWATMVAEKMPSGFVYDDDAASNGSWDLHGSSEDFFERSRESSLSRNASLYGLNGPTGLPTTVPVSSPLFEVLARHYAESIETASRERRDVMLNIEISSCSRCHSCSGLVYDEILMDGWNADDSNLNTLCSFCTTKFVPLLTISLKDLRPAPDKSGEESLVDLGPSTSEAAGRTTKSRPTKSIKVVDPFTVPYLSPLVLRKEVENVVSEEGDYCFLSDTFIDNHPIIFWNLIWFFSRVNLPTHLTGLAFQHSALKNSDSDVEVDFRNVQVNCFWDHESIYCDIGRPMYHLWLEAVENKNWIPVDEMRVSSKYIHQILECIRNNDLLRPMQLLIEERVRMASLNRPVAHQSIYRDLIFLSFLGLGRQNIDLIAFDREYRRAFDHLGPMEQMTLTPADQPPAHGAIFCRRAFKELDLPPEYCIFPPISYPCCDCAQATCNSPQVAQKSPENVSQPSAEETTQPETRVDKS